MIDLFKKIFKLGLSVEDKRILDALNASNIASKRVIGRGTLTVKVSDITSSDKFKEYTRKATEIVAYQNR